MKNESFERVRKYIEEYRMIHPKDVVLAGVSGGADSTAMLDMLVRLSAEWGFVLEVIHVDHKIRGKEAERDRKHVENLCRDYGIPCRVSVYDVPALAKEWRAGLEETGRKVRRMAYGQAEEYWQRQGRTVRIALAHNRNDLSETMLHHLARGTGLRGLAGIRPVAGTIIRPVLCLERSEIDQYIKERQLTIVEDSSNSHDDYTRNRIRHHILPLLTCEVNEQAAAHMAETAALMADADDYFTDKGKALAGGCIQPDGSYLLGASFLKKERILKQYALLEMLGILAGRRKDLTTAHVKAVLALEENSVGSRADLPQGILAIREYKGIRLTKKQDRERQKKQEQEQIEKTAGEWELSVPGRLECALGSVETRIFFYEGQEIFEKKYTKWLDYDKIRYHPRLRTRQPGDFLVLNGEGQRKKLTRCMIDDKIPREERVRIPLIACGNEVLWMVGGRMNESYKITTDTRRVLEIRYQGGNENG